MKRLFTSIFLMFVVIGALTTIQAATHTIIATVQGGTITPNGNVSVANGNSETFSWTPFNDCWEFDVLLVDNQPTTPTGSNQYTFENVNTDHTIHVIFKQIVYTIEATAGPNGTITPNGTVNVKCGESQTFTFTPATGFEVETVLVNSVPEPGTPTSYTFSNVKQAGQTIHVTFKAEEPPPPDSFWINITVTPSPTGGGWGTTNPVAPGIKVPAGTTHTVQINAKTWSYGDPASYTIKSITHDGNSVTPNTPTSHPISIINIDKNHDIEVEFEEHVSVYDVEIPELEIYPTPTTGRLSIVSGEVAISKIEVTNTLGNVVMVIENPADVLDLSALSKGTYFLRFTTSKGSAIRQVIRN